VPSRWVATVRLAHPAGAFRHAALQGSPCNGGSAHRKQRAAAAAAPLRLRWPGRDHPPVDATAKPQRQARQKQGGDIGITQHPSLPARAGVAPAAGLTPNHRAHRPAGGPGLQIAAALLVVSGH